MSHVFSMTRKTKQPIEVVLPRNQIGQPLESFIPDSEHYDLVESSCLGRHDNYQQCDIYEHHSTGEKVTVLTDFVSQSAEETNPNLPQKNINPRHVSIDYGDRKKLSFWGEGASTSLDEMFVRRQSFANGTVLCDGRGEGYPTEIVTRLDSDAERGHVSSLSFRQNGFVYTTENICQRFSGVLEVLEATHSIVKMEPGRKDFTVETVEGYFNVKS